MEYEDYLKLLNKRSKPKRHIETDIQMELVEWISNNYPDLIFTCTTAGLNLPIKTATRLKRMGLRKDFPDLAIFKARMGYNGLLIEIKTDTGFWSNNQKEMALRLNKEGFKSECCFGIESAKKTIKNYMEGI